MGEITEYPQRIGRPPYAPTEKERAIVENAAAFGEPHAKIARFLDIDLKTLYKYFRDELDNGSFRANMKIGKTLYELATESKDENVRFRCAAYWAARRMGWTENVVNIHARANDGEARSISAGMSEQEAIQAYQSMLRDDRVLIPFRKKEED